MFKRFLANRNRTSGVTYNKQNDKLKAKIMMMIMIHI